MIRALSSSLSLRLLFIFILATILLLFILVTSFASGMDGQWRRTIQPHLVQYVQYLQQDLGSPPSSLRADQLSQSLNVDIYIYQQDELVHATNEKQLALNSLNFVTVTNRLPQTMREKIVETGIKAYVSRSKHFRRPILRIDQDQHSIYYDLGTENRQTSYSGRPNFELTKAIIGLSLVLLASYFAIRHLIRPIRQIQSSVHRMSNAELSHRINRSGNSDLDELAHSIDGMAERLEALLDAKRQLLMALSHELRSPVTRARITTELLPDSRNRERLIDDLSNMERMINDIMESERLQSHHSVLNKEEVNVSNILSDELLHSVPEIVIEQKDIQQGLLVNADAARLKIAFRNLLLNADQHGKDGTGTTQLDVSLEQQGDQIVVSIRDYGQGIEPEHLKRITDPLYRPDSSRTRTTGGFGMGLTLARLIVEAHQGEINIESKPTLAPGTKLTVRLPTQ